MFAPTRCESGETSAKTSLPMMSSLRRSSSKSGKPPLISTSSEASLSTLPAVTVSPDFLRRGLSSFHLRREEIAEAFSSLMDEVEAPQTQTQTQTQTSPTQTQTQTQTLTQTQTQTQTQTSELMSNAESSMGFEDEGAGVVVGVGVGAGGVSEGGASREGYVGEGGGAVGGISRYKPLNRGPVWSEEEAQTQTVPQTTQQPQTPVRHSSQITPSVVSPTVGIPEALSLLGFSGKFPTPAFPHTIVSKNRHAGLTTVPYTGSTKARVGGEWGEVDGDSAAAMVVPDSAGIYGRSSKSAGTQFPGSRDPSRELPRTSASRPPSGKSQFQSIEFPGSRDPSKTSRSSRPPSGMKLSPVGQGLGQGQGSDSGKSGETVGFSDEGDTGESDLTGKPPSSTTSTSTFSTKSRPQSSKRGPKVSTLSQRQARSRGSLVQLQESKEGLAKARSLSLTTAMASGYSIPEVVRAALGLGGEWEGSGKGDWGSVQKGSASWNPLEDN